MRISKLRFKYNPLFKLRIERKRYVLTEVERRRHVPEEGLRGQVSANVVGDEMSDE